MLSHCTADATYIAGANPVPPSNARPSRRREPPTATASGPASSNGTAIPSGMRRSARERAGAQRPYVRIPHEP